MLADVTAGVWSELDLEDAPSIGLHRRNLQRAHVELLAARLQTADSASDMPALARGELTRLLAQSKQTLARNPEQTTARHLQDVGARIKLALETIRVERQPSPNAQRSRGRGFEDSEPWCLPPY